MILAKSEWKKTDVEEFQKYLVSFENPEKREWSTNLLKTNLPVLCLKTANIKDIVSGILEGNYLSFLDLMLWEYYENTAINGMIINYIDDFDLKKKYLDIYSKRAENWATCDLLTFNVKGNEDKYYSMVLEYIKSDKPFVRRIGMYILFNFIDNDTYVDKIFELLDTFTNEEDYYVNMMNGWLLCECYIKRKEKTIRYFKNNKANKKIINKAIQKCRESRRLSKEEKDSLLEYKK